MSNATAHEEFLRFVRESNFSTNGAFITDLDGTALHEDRGRITIPEDVRRGVKAIHDIGRPVIINTLRFPLSVMRTIGLEWFEISKQPIPTVLLNGSVLGTIHRNAIGILAYEEIAAFPLREEEIARTVDGVRELLDAGINDFVVFYYPRDWIRGEFIWTPNRGEVDKIQRKFVSSTRAQHFDAGELFDEIARWDSCMIFVLVNEDEDRLMAYQHSNRSSFITRSGVDKASGTRIMAETLAMSLPDSFGAGDTVMDTFLSETGLAVHVGGGEVPYQGKFGTVKVRDSLELGSMLQLISGQEQGFLTKV